MASFWRTETTPSSIFPHTPSRAKYRAEASEGFRRVLPQTDLGSCLGNMSFPLTESLPGLLVFYGPLCALGITTTDHTMSLQSLGWVVSMSFLDFSVPWYHCCQGCMTASSVAPGPPLSSSCLPGDKGRASYPIHPTLVSQPLSQPRPRRVTMPRDSQAGKSGRDFMV